MRPSVACAAGRNEAIAFEDPPHGRDRGHVVDLAPEVMCDGLGSSVMSGGGQLAAKLADELLDFGFDLVRAGFRSPGARL